MYKKNLGDIGEFGLIDRISKRVKIYHPIYTQKGIGDDAAVINSLSKVVLLSTDLLLEGVHFDLSYMPLKHLGYKAVVVNISDIIAMNAIPRQITVSIGLSNRFNIEAVDELYSGIHKACENYQIDIIGGDTTTSRKGMIISISILGNASRHRITYRNTAEESEIICVTGDLGAAYMGLQFLEREKFVFFKNPSIQPKLTGKEKEYTIERQIKPEAKVSIIQLFEQLNIIPTAMIDISDGLASELLHICRQSKIGALIYEDKLPIRKETSQAAIQEFNMNPTTCALNGGEDYELLFTIKSDDYEKIKTYSDIFSIGYTTSFEKGVFLVTVENEYVKIQAQGWKHF